MKSRMTACNSEWPEAPIKRWQYLTTYWLNWQPFMYLRVQTGKATNIDSSSCVNGGGHQCVATDRDSSFRVINWLIGLIIERPEAALLTGLPLVSTANRSSVYHLGSSTLGTWGTFTGYLPTALEGETLYKLLVFLPYLYFQNISSISMHCFCCKKTMLFFKLPKHNYNIFSADVIKTATDNTLKLTEPKGRARLQSLQGYPSSDTN